MKVYLLVILPDQAFTIAWQVFGDDTSVKVLMILAAGVIPSVALPSAPLRPGFSTELFT